MTAVKHRPAQVNSRPAWVAVALTPIVWFVVILAGFAGEDAGGSQVLASAWASLVSAAAPTAGVILAVRAVRAGDRSGRIAAVVSAVLLVATFAFLPVLVISMGPGWAIALAVVVLTLGVVEWASTRKPLPPAA